MDKPEMDNVRCWINASPHSADYSLLVQMVGPKGEPLATVATIKVAPGMERELYLVLQGIRMALRNPGNSDG